MPDKPDKNDQQEDVEEDAFGYSLKGSWDEIVDFGETITQAFRDEKELEDETVDRWNEWRPRRHEENEEMREKTIEEAKIDEGEDATEMADEAAEHLSETTKKTTEGEIEEAAENATESAKSAGKAVEGASRSVWRGIEDKVYRTITMTNPLYFDTKEFNVSLEKASSIGEKVGKVKQKLNGEGDD
ncbi:MAG: DUF5828 family protein [Halobacteria archaeon]|nr:DUF5828 family protein [Halobacteria archaeon]